MAEYIDRDVAADVRPVMRGKWEKHDASLVWNSCGLYASAYKCNKCGGLNIAETNFCPNCGADMRIFSTNCKNNVTTGEDEEVKLMCDDLIARLYQRIALTTAGTPLQDDLLEAADAIEELSKYAETMRKLKCEGWYLQQTKYHDGYQAIATMPLPEPPKEE